MKNNKLLLLALIFCFGFTSQKETQTEIWVGSTPCSDELKVKLGINEKDSVDFIRWDLRLIDSKRFTLTIHYGISKPNTLGFITGGEHKSFDGMVLKSKSNQGPAILTLHSPLLKSNINFAALSSHVYHFLNEQNKLMVGNGGWSYSLSNKDSVRVSENLPRNISPLDFNIENSTLTFVGRTPCEPVNSEYNLALSESCLKIKWLMKLYVDPVTKRPTSFHWSRTGNRTSLIEGTWSIEKINDAVICHFRLRKPFEAMDLVVVDENILYFLDKNHNLMAGDENFSFALNRITK